MIQLHHRGVIHLPVPLGLRGEEIEGGIYCCDLLSIVMGRAPADGLWVTVMGNLNSIAVAVLTDSACILLAEGMALDGDVLLLPPKPGVLIQGHPLRQKDLLGLFQEGGLTMTVAGAVLLVFGVNLLLGRFAAGVRESQDNRIRFFDDRVEYAGRQEQGFAPPSKTARLQGRQTAHPAPDYTYSQVLRLGESREYFFLYVAKNRALVVEKARMSLGTPGWAGRGPHGGSGTW